VTTEAAVVVFSVAIAVLLTWMSRPLAIVCVGPVMLSVPLLLNVMSPVRAPKFVVAAMLTVPALITRPPLNVLVVELRVRVPPVPDFTSVSAPVLSLTGALIVIAPLPVVT